MNFPCHTLYHKENAAAVWTDILWLLLTHLRIHSFIRHYGPATVLAATIRLVSQTSQVNSHRILV